MIRHILFLTFKSEASSAAKQRVRQAFLHIHEHVEGVEAVEWGENDSPEGKNEDFTHCVLMTFRDEKIRQLYLPHVKHEELKKLLRPVLS